MRKPVVLVVWSLVGLLTLLPAAHQAFAGVRFCTKDDGKVRIERLHAGDDAVRPCAEPGKRTASARGGRSVSHDALRAATGSGLFEAVCTHVCFEDAAASHVSSHRQGLTAQDLQPALSGAALHFPEARADAPLRPAAASPPPVSPLFAPLRSIVLLI